MSAHPIAAPPLRILPIPEHAVPAVPVDAAEAAGLDERQLAMGLDLLSPGPGTRAHRIASGAPRARHRALLRRAVVVPDDDGLNPGPPERPTDLEQLRHWVAKLVPALLEAAAGTRPAPQLMRWVSPAVYDGLLRRHARAVRRGSAVRRPLRVVRVVLREPVPTVVEASVVFADGPRVRAAALRFVPVDRRWVADAFEVG